MSRGKSPLIIGDLDAYLRLPRTTGAPTLNSEEPDKGENLLPARTVHGVATLRIESTATRQ